MSKIKYFLIAIMAILLASCKKEPGTVNPESSSVKGDLSTYFEVVDKDYTIADNGSLTFEMKKVKDDFPAPWHTGMMYKKYPDYTNEFKISFSVKLYDEKGNFIAEGYLGYGEELATLKNGESTKVTISIPKEYRQKAATFIVSSRLRCGEDSPTSSAAESSTETTDASSETATEEATEDNSSSGSEDYDAVLDEYEEYTKKLVSMAKKLEAGDMTVYTDYMGLVESMTSLDKKLANAKSEMTNAQTARFLRIQAKYLKALSKAK